MEDFLCTYDGKESPGSGEGLPLVAPGHHGHRHRRGRYPPNQEQGCGSGSALGGETSRIRLEDPDPETGGKNRQI